MLSLASGSSEDYWRAGGKARQGQIMFSCPYQLVFLFWCNDKKSILRKMSNITVLRIFSKFHKLTTILHTLASAS